MSKALRRLWQAVFTVVGGDRRVLTTLLMSPSSDRGAVDRGRMTVTSDSHADIGGTGEPEREDAPEAAILDALDENEGRLDQREIPDIADLSQSTVSRRLIAMEERGEVNRYEIGRRKVVFVPGEEPEAFDSSLHGDETRHETPS